MDFHGKAALVTGASRGIGLATALNLATGGAALALVCASIAVVNGAQRKEERA